jgi:hypothetical protein
MALRILAGIRIDRRAVVNPEGDGQEGRPPPNHHSCEAGLPMSHSENATVLSQNLIDKVGNVFERAPYSADHSWRRLQFPNIIAGLTRHHYQKCIFYKNILTALNVNLRIARNLSELPFLPVGLFKRLDLVSVPASEIFRTLSSSGTSGSIRSRIFLDRETSMLQMLALVRIVTSFIGEHRLPLLIVDAPWEPDDQAGYEARAVAIQGFSLFGTGRTTFALTEKMQPDFKSIDEFLRATRGKKFLLFGFTYVIWRCLFEHLDRNDIHLDLANGILIHGGGWKRLANESVSDSIFKRYAKERTGLTSVHNYYGMVEQPGSIYMQCEQGFMHCSNFSEIFIRRPDDLSIAGCGELGIIQTISVLPRSYPGHNLLTDDMGVLNGEDCCSCGRPGKYFEVVGRLPSAEPKGCGDTHF